MPKTSSTAALQQIRRRTQTYELVEHIRTSQKKLLRLDQQVRVKGVETSINISGPCWLLALIEVRRGKTQFLCGQQRVDPPARRFGLFLPAWAIAQVEVDKAHYHSTALLSVTRLPDTFPAEPVLFRPHRWRCPRSLEEVCQLVERCRAFISVNRAPIPSLLSQRIKKNIDSSYRTAKSLSAMARELRIAPATMSRYFKRDYGIPPVRYRHHVRIMDGMVRLLEGEAIADVFQEVGFADVSRFYKQFGAIACVRPGQYHLKRSKNAKTPVLPAC